MRASFLLHLGPLSQLCQQLAKKSVWQLRSGLLVSSKDGCFLQVSGLHVLPMLSLSAILYQSPIVWPSLSQVNWGPEHRAILLNSALLDMESHASEQQFGLRFRLGQLQSHGLGARGHLAAAITTVCCPLQDAVPDLSALAQDFMQRHVPLFTVPWRVKLDLEAAGCAVKAVSPATIRSSVARPTSSTQP